MTITYYLDEDGGRHGSLPTLWKNRTPMNWQKLQRLGWTMHQEEVPDPPKTYSKYLIKKQLDDLGIWAQVRLEIEAAGFWDSFLLIQGISSDNPEFQAALPLLAKAFPNVDIPALLRDCEV